MEKIISAIVLLWLGGLTFYGIQSTNNPNKKTPTLRLIHDTIRVPVHDTIYRDIKRSQLDGIYTGWWMGISYEAEYLGRHKMQFPSREEIDKELDQELLPFE
jgi:hypothetical protein